jgi:hypothetical protein
LDICLRDIEDETIVAIVGEAITYPEVLTSEVVNFGNHEHLRILLKAGSDRESLRAILKKKFPQLAINAVKTVKRAKNVTP